MVSALGITNRILSLGLSACIVIAVALTLSNAVKFQFIGSKKLGFEVSFGNESFHGHDSQTVDIDPSQRGSPFQAAVAVDDPLTAAYYPPGNGTSGNGNGTSGNSSLPQTGDLRVVVDDTIGPSLRESTSDSQAAVLDDPRAAHYPPGISARGNSSLPHISGLRVAFVGDSLTRYMYLSLAAYLRQGRWVDEKDVPNILEEKQFGGWSEFYNYTNNYFQPYEQCDCFRPEGRVRKTIENRYFIDPVRDNALYFFQK
jgi:hypothetical protein